MKNPFTWWRQRRERIRLIQLDNAKAATERKAEYDKSVSILVAAAAQSKEPNATASSKASAPLQNAS